MTGDRDTGRCYPFYALSTEKTLNDRLGIYGDFAWADAGWHSGTATQSKYAKEHIIRYPANSAASPSKAMEMPIGSSAASPVVTVIEDEGNVMMSKADRKEIERMHRDGYGPTHIARKLELSVNTVKSHICRHPSLRNAVYCLQCGRAMSKTPGRKKRNSVPTHAEASIGIISTAKEAAMEKQMKSTGRRT